MAPPPPDTYTLSLHDALPIYAQLEEDVEPGERDAAGGLQLAADAGNQARVGTQERDPGLHREGRLGLGDRKSTRLNSSHSQISYAVFCLKKKMTNITVKRDHK